MMLVTALDTPSLLKLNHLQLRVPVVSIDVMCLLWRSTVELSIPTKLHSFAKADLESCPHGALQTGENNPEMRGCNIEVITVHHSSTELAGRANKWF